VYQSAGSLEEEKYPAHFVAKVSDSDMENSETIGWLDFSLACRYLNQVEYGEMKAKSEEIGRLLNHMMENPDKY